MAQNKYMGIIFIGIILVVMFFLVKPSFKTTVDKGLGGPTTSSASMEIYDINGNLVMTEQLVAQSLLETVIQSTTSQDQSYTFKSNRDVPFWGAKGKFKFKIINKGNVPLSIEGSGFTSVGEKRFEQDRLCISQPSTGTKSYVDDQGCQHWDDVEMDQTTYQTTPIFYGNMPYRLELEIQSGFGYVPGSTTCVCVHNTCGVYEIGTNYCLFNFAGAVSSSRRYLSGANELHFKISQNDYGGIKPEFA